jgi:glycosyltransferase involved in cell wall biosynthesis
MKICAVCFVELEALPPVISVIDELLRQRHQVTVITMCKDKYSDYFKDNKNVTFKYLYVTEIVKPKWIRKNRYFEYAWSILFPKLRARRAQKVYKLLESSTNDFDFVWVMHEETARMMGRRLLHQRIQYVLTIFELDLCVHKSVFLPHVAMQALAVVVPEYCRAHILYAIWRLKHLPKILPNKPSKHPQTLNMRVSDGRIAALIKEIKASEKKIILYMGIFLPERKLDTIIEAIARMNDKYVLVLLGYDNCYLAELKEKFGEKFIYAGHLSPPEHLAVASHAHIGILTYVATGSGSINPVFCAPNKVFEYAGFGIPMLCNDIPGLKYQVEYSQMGVCADIDSIQDICSKIQYIESQYADMSKNARKYYKSVEIDVAVELILKDVEARIC